MSSANPGFISLPSTGVNITAPILGVFAGCEFFSPTVGRMVWSSFFPGSVGSSNTCNAYVIEDPNQLFLVQGTTVSVIGTSCIGLNVGFTSTGAQPSGNQTTGISNVALASSTVTGLSSQPLAFRVVDTTSNYAPPGTNGTDGTAAGAVVVVGFSNQLRRSITAAST